MSLTRPEDALHLPSSQQTRDSHARGPKRQIQANYSFLLKNFTYCSNSNILFKKRGLIKHLYSCLYKLPAQTYRAPYREHLWMNIEVSFASAVACDHAPSPLHITDVGKEGTIHFLIGSHVKKPESVFFFTDCSRNNTY